MPDIGKGGGILNVGCTKQWQLGYQKILGSGKWNEVLK